MFSTTLRPVSLFPSAVLLRHCLFSQSKPCAWEATLRSLWSQIVLLACLQTSARRSPKLLEHKVYGVSTVHKSIGMQMFKSPIADKGGFLGWYSWQWQRQRCHVPPIGWKFLWLKVRWAKQKAPRWKAVFPPTAFPPRISSGFEKPCKGGWDRR